MNTTDTNPTISYLSKQDDQTIIEHWKLTGAMMQTASFEQAEELCETRHWVLDELCRRGLMEEFHMCSVCLNTLDEDGNCPEC